MSIQGLQTEERNPRSIHIDTVSTEELCQIINDEDAKIAGVVEQCIPVIANAINALTPRVRQGGRVVYVGAGTSGRLGVLDASEIPPTYSASPAQFVGLIAGGDQALRSALEGAEDSIEEGVADLEALVLNGEVDSLIGIAASGRTPYVLGCLAFAKSRGCVTIGIACAAPSAMSTSGNVDFMIEAVTGPEVVTGSTRMKAGTATKLVLNTLSSGVMIKSGKTYENIMIDVKPTNAKLQQRARRILRMVCGDACPRSDEDLDAELQACERSVKLAAAKISLGISVEEAKARLQDANGVLTTLLRSSKPISNGIEPKDDEPQYVLCIDAGGSKCQAVIMNAQGVEGVGESGPCNPTDIGIAGATAAIDLATRRAVESCASTRGKRIQDLPWRRVWVGMAGGDREPLGARMRLEFLKLFGARPGLDLNVTNDINLLANAARHYVDVKSVFVLIAGTGSIAVQYRLDHGEFSQVSRSGGWGWLLGDDGSGFAIGRQAIRIALRQLEEQSRMKKQESSGKSLDPLPGLITEYYRTSDSHVKNFDLLTSVMLASSDNAQSASNTKRRIASCAKLVVNAISDSEQARKIVDSAIDSLVDLLVPLWLGSSSSDTQGSALVLAGGLMQSETFQDLLKARLVDAGLSFKHVELIDHPAAVGARYLAQIGSKPAPTSSSR